MRYPAACVSTDPMGLLPFSGDGETGATATYQPLTEGVDWLKFYEWWFRVKTWLLEVTIAFDPGTVAPGAPNPGTYQIVLERQGVGAGEREMLKPGVTTGASHAPTSEFIGTLSVTSPDDYFTAIEWTATMQICPLSAPGGYTATGDAGKPQTRYTVNAALREFTPTITLVVSASYDDGSVGIFSIQLHDPNESAFPPADVLTTAGTMDSIPLTGYAIDFSPTYADGGVPPVVTLTPVEWFEFCRSNGTEPIYDSATGEVVPGQTPYTNIL